MCGEEQFSLYSHIEWHSTKKEKYKKSSINVNNLSPIHSIVMNIMEKRSIFLASSAQRNLFFDLIFYRMCLLPGLRLINVKKMTGSIFNLDWEQEKEKKRHRTKFIFVLLESLHKHHHNYLLIPSSAYECTQNLDNFLV